MPLVQYLGYKGITEYGKRIVEGREPLEKINKYTRQLLHQLRSPRNKIPGKATPISYEDYSEEVKRLLEGTSSGPSVVTPVMINTGIMDTELAEIGWRGFNFPWCTGYSPSRYRKVIDHPNEL